LLFDFCWAANLIPFHVETLSQARREEVLAVLAPFACGGAAEELTTITEGCDHDDPGRDGAERGRDY
jgi:hypothetical protein